MADATVHKPSARQGRLRLMTLGGCNVLEIGSTLAGIWDHTHVWNVTWPSLGSKAFPLMRWPDGPEFAELQDFLARETRKTVPATVRAARPGILLLAPAQNVLNDFVVLGDRIMPDFTTGLYLSPRRLDGRPRPRLADFVAPGHRVVTPEAPEYADLVKEGFRRAYKRLLRPLIAKGTRVFIHGHVLATQALTGEGVFDDVSNVTRLQMNLVGQFIAHAMTYPGIELLEQVPGLNFTSDDAPNGRWAFHPIREQYAILAHRLAQRVSPEQAEAVLVRFLFESRRQQLKLREQSLLADSARRQAAEAERKAQERRKAAERDLALTKGSLSWRVTAPLRAVRSQWPAKAPERKTSAND